MRPSSASQEGAVRLEIVAVGGVALLLICLAGLPAPVPVAAQPRPTLTPTTAPLPPTPSVPPGPGPALPAAPPCESICGRVINLEANTGEPGQTVRFAGAGWSVEAVTDADGDYAYGRLGTDVGFLNLVVPEGSDLHPITADIPVAPVPGWPIVVNLGAYRGVRTAPLLAPTVQAEPVWVRRGGRVTFTVQVENRLPTKISGVMVTDFLPEGLVLSGVASDRGDTVWAGSYGAAFIGDLGPAEVATVWIIADVPLDTTPGSIRNQVSLVYREHAAAQAVAAVTVGEATTAAAAAPTPASAATVTPASTPQTLPTTGPPLLPVTGYGLTAVGVGLALGAAALAARRARKHRERDIPLSSQRKDRHG